MPATPSHLQHLSVSKLHPTVSTTSSGGSSITVSPDIINLFKSIDLNNDYKIAISELIKSKALLGSFYDEKASQNSYTKMDTNSDVQVDFQEYTTEQASNYAASPYVIEKTTFSQGHIALAIIKAIHLFATRSYYS